MEYALKQIRWPDELKTHLRKGGLKAPFRKARKATKENQGQWGFSDKLSLAQPLGDFTDFPDVVLATLKEEMAYLRKNGPTKPGQLGYTSVFGPDCLVSIVPHYIGPRFIKFIGYGERV